MYTWLKEITLLKPKEYQKQFNLFETEKFNRTQFCSLVLEDFTNLLKTHPKMNPTHFQNDVSNMKEKWDRIFMGTKVSYDNAEKFWKYFFAVKIIPIRNVYFPDWKKAVHEYRMATDQTYKIKYQNWKWHKEEEEEMEQMRKDMMQGMLDSFEEYFRKQKERVTEDLKKEAAEFKGMVNEAKALLGIGEEETLSEELVNTQFRYFAKLFHPDLSQKETNTQFIRVKEAQEVLLKSLGLSSKIDTLEESA
jgi:hypothetical protein